MDLLETAATEVESLAIPEPQDATFATIDKIFDDGVTLIFDGQEAATEKHYKVNSFAIFKEQDRVRIIKDSGTYVVEYTVGKPKKTFNADTADSAKTAQTAASATTAQTAQSANKAESATTAETATSATNATNAEKATNADSATNATSAEKAAALIDAASSSGKVYLKISSSKLSFGSSTTSMYEVPKLGLPTGGSSGQVLVKTGSSDGAAGWSTLTGLLPEGGSANQVLVKDTSTNHDVSWATIGTLPTGGSTGQCLVKDTATNYDVSWGSPSVSRLYVSNYNYVTLNDSRQLIPHTYNTSYPYSLGSSSYPWTNLYIGRGVIKLGDNANYTTIGFFGTTPQSRKTLSTSSNNMGYSSATSSNYLTVINNIAGILKTYGLIAT